MNAIETTYKGYKFRSRLEAKWACVFDQLGWEWEYEPIDFNGYIPDFYIDFGKRQWYVEIKPAMKHQEFDEAIAKANRSRGEFIDDEYEHWSNPFLVLGGKFADGFSVCGGCNGVSIHAALEDTRLGIVASDVHLVRCPACKRLVPVTYEGCWEMPCCEMPTDIDNSSGYSPTFNKHWTWADTPDKSEVDAIWAAAHNATQWKPTRR